MKVYALFWVEFGDEGEERERLIGLHASRDFVVPTPIVPCASRKEYFVTMAFGGYLVEELDLELPTVTKADKFRVGLALLGNRITRASFYNSSGGDADFELTSPPTEEEQAILKKLGWAASTHPEYGRHASFAEWSEKV